jgi:TRAP-type C4-dicarboxylate transport system substrate-binding protein
MTNQANSEPMTIGIGYAATDEEIKRLQELARHVSEATGRKITVKLTPKGEQAKVDEKLSALFERSFGEKL